MKLRTRVFEAASLVSSLLALQQAKAYTPTPCVKAADCGSPNIWDCVPPPAGVPAITTLVCEVKPAWAVCGGPAVVGGPGPWCSTNEFNDGVEQVNGDFTPFVGCVATASGATNPVCCTQILYDPVQGQSYGGGCTYDWQCCDDYTSNAPDWTLSSQPVQASTSPMPVTGFTYCRGNTCQTCTPDGKQTGIASCNGHGQTVCADAYCCNLFGSSDGSTQSDTCCTPTSQACTIATDKTAKFPSYCCMSNQDPSLVALQQIERSNHQAITPATSECRPNNDGSQFGKCCGITTGTTTAACQQASDCCNGQCNMKTGTCSPSTDTCN